ncbi:hypothetical protein FM103_10825 [Corynebacterium xerosis]|nr:hypothetical protein FM103_10825 [Corynebacterium xerosis]
MSFLHAGSIARLQRSFLQEATFLTFAPPSILGSVTSG